MSATKHFYAMTLHWTLHPDKVVGLYEDSETGKPRSPWYDNEIESKQMSADAVARELDCSDEGSVEGIIFTQFNDRHIARGPIKINPNLPVIRTFDFGACCAVLFAQKDNYNRLFFFHEIIIEKNGNANKLAQAALSYSADLKCKGFRDYCDPAGKHDSWVSGQSSIDILRKHGITPTYGATEGSRTPRGDRIENIHAKLDTKMNGEESILIHESMQTTIDAFQGGYRRPINRNGEVVVDDVEEVHPYEDVMDNVGMTIMEAAPVRSKQREVKRKKRSAVNPYTGRKRH